MICWIGLQNLVRSTHDFHTFLLVYQTWIEKLYGNIALKSCLEILYSIFESTSNFNGNEFCEIIFESKLFSLISIKYFDWEEMKYV